MNGIIKFRAWDREENKMIDNIHEHDFEAFLFSEPYEIMQFTGLLDNLGKEIFEGDIVECGELKRCKECNQLSGEPVTYCIKWNESTLCWYLGTSGGALYLNNGGYKVIGNIYENPELPEH